MTDEEEQVGLHDEPERFGGVQRIVGLAWQICSVDVVRTLVVVVGMHSAEMEEMRHLESLAVVMDHEQHLAKVRLVVEAGLTWAAHC